MVCVCVCVCVVVLDQRVNSSSQTGRFELIYRATNNPNTKGCETKFVVEGQRITKLDLQRYLAIDRKLMRQQQQQQQQSADHAKHNNGNDDDDDVAVTSDRHGNGAVSQTLQSQLAGECIESATASAHAAAPAGGRVTHAVAAASSPKMYRGLRQSTVQIYNAR